MATMFKLVATCEIVQICLILTCSTYAKTQKEKPQVATLQHRQGAFKCLGGLLSQDVVITCCTCVSDIAFRRPTCDGSIGYDITALEPENVSVTIGDSKLLPTDILLHPQCDIDGTFDYAIVKMPPKPAGGCASNTVDKKKIGVKNPFACKTGEAQGGLAGQNEPCILETEFTDYLPQPNKRRKISVKFVSSDYCWNGNETDPTFESKYCVKSENNSPINNAKGGSPIICSGKLVGIVARKYAVGGHKYTPVNGLDGALSFVQQVLEESQEPDEEYLIKTGLKKMRKRRKSKYLKKRIKHRLI